MGNGSPGAGAGVIGTPDDLVAAIRHLQEITGGFGVVLGFAHDWANREATMRSWELVARYVIPELNGYTAGLRESQEYLNRHQAELMAGRFTGSGQQDPRQRQGRSRDADHDGAGRTGRSREGNQAVGVPPRRRPAVVGRLTSSAWRFGGAPHRKTHAQNGECQSSLRATAFGVTFIFGS